MSALSSRSISRPRLLIALALLAVALLLLHLGYSLPAAVQFNGSLRHHLWLDDIPRTQGDLASTSGQLTASMNRPPSGVIWLENTFQAEVSLTLNGLTVYEGRTSTEIQISPDLPAWFDVVLDYHMPPTIPDHARLGFMQRGLLGETYVQPAWDYQAPSLLHDLARTGFWIVLSLSLICVLAALPLTRREAALLVILWVLALGVQGITLAEKLQNSPAHFTMENTWDNYVDMGRAWLRGTEGIAGQDTQVANFVYIGILHLVLEPDFTTFYGVNAILGSVVPPLLALAVFALFRRWSIALVTGVLTALFMPLVHYQQTLQPEAIAHVPLALLLCSGALLYRHPSVFWALACGALVGICTVMRGSWLLLILWVGVVLLINGISWRRKISYGLLAGVALVAAMAPIIFINFSHGIYMLTPTRSDMQLFRANGLDSLGLASYDGISERVMFAQKSNYTDALRKDIARDPLRLIELTLRRIGLIWQSEEHSDADQVDYENYSLKVSPTTQLLSLNGMITFRTLLVLALSGALLGMFTQRRAALLLLAGAGVWMLTMIPFYSLARFRIGMAIFLLPLAALALWEIGTFLSSILRPEAHTLSTDQVSTTKPTSVSRLILIGLGLILINGAVLWAADWLTDHMPRPQLVSEAEFPSDFVPVSAVFGDQIQLLGYAQYETDAVPGGYLVLELFWRALAKPTEDVVVTLRLMDTETEEIVYTENVRLGMNTAPAWPPTLWNAGDILFEKYYFRLPDQIDRSYGLFVGLYSMAQDDALVLTQPTGEAIDEHLRVTAVSTLSEEQRSAEALPPLATWQDALALVDTECVVNADGLSMDLTWQMEQRVTQDVRLFVHVFEGDTLIAQRDQRLDPPADSLPPRAQVTTHIKLPEIKNPAVLVRIGFYRFSDGQRLPITLLAEGWTQTDAVVNLSCDD